MHWDTYMRAHTHVHTYIYIYIYIYRYISTHAFVQGDRYKRAYWGVLTDMHGLGKRNAVQV